MKACLFAVVLSSTLAVASPSKDIDVAVGDVPKDFKVRELERDFVKRAEMIPMRDGVKLNTLVFIPKGAKNAPILMDRTPYNVAIYEPYIASDQFLRAGYIRVFQDTRGKHGSEGNYIVTMPARGPLNPGPVDHATDSWDTIEWLVKNIPESNGRVGMMGSSYEGFTTVIVDGRDQPCDGRRSHRVVQERCLLGPPVGPGRLPSEQATCPGFPPRNGRNTRSSKRMRAAGLRLAPEELRPAGGCPESQS